MFSRISFLMQPILSSPGSPGRWAFALILSSSNSAYNCPSNDDKVGSSITVNDGTVPNTSFAVHIFCISLSTSSLSSSVAFLFVILTRSANSGRPVYQGLQLGIGLYSLDISFHCPSCPIPASSLSCMNNKVFGDPGFYLRSCYILQIICSGY